MKIIQKICIGFLTTLPLFLHAENLNEKFLSESQNVYKKALVDEIPLLTLTSEQIDAIFPEIIGIPYVNELPILEVSTNLLIRRLYAQIRNLATLPICPCSCEPAVWLEFSGGTSFFKRDKHSQSFIVEDYEATIGLQRSFNLWTIGGAFSYEYETKNFHHRNHGKSDAFLGALYGLYRPEGSYALIDLVGGYHSGRTHRRILFGAVDLRSQGRPRAYDVSLYAEIGKDFGYRNLLFQPFVGIEGGYYDFRRISESGVSGINLMVHQKSYGIANSRLGFHLSTWDEKFHFEYGFDLSWQYRLTAPHNSRKITLEIIDDSFQVKGVRSERSSFDGAFSLAKKIDALTMFVQLEGQVSTTFANYNVMGGFQFEFDCFRNRLQ